MVTLTIDGNVQTVDVPAAQPLLWVLRENLGLTGTKYGCGMGLCGACTVLVDGRAVRSCVTPARLVDGATVETIETLNDPLGQSIKTAWCDGHVAQCGYCQPGQIVATYALLSRRALGEDIDFKASLTNLCRCGTYGRIHAAIDALVSDLDGAE